MKPSVLLAFACALSISACKGGTEKATSRQRGPRQPAFPVEVLHVDARPHDLVVTAPGMVDAFEHTQVTARVSGVVDRITFVEGQEVKAGQGLAYIDSRRYALAVSFAQAALQKAEATAADNAQSVKRRENASASNPGLIPGEELETYRTRLRTAQADVEVAREALKLAQVNLDDSTVRAPVAGIIQTRTVQTGQYVQAGTVIATLLRRDPLLLRFNLTTAEAPRIKTGMPAEFTLKESSHSYQAKITLVGGAADSESRLVPVTAEVESDRQFWLRPGSFAQVRIKLTSTRRFPMIPQTAARPSDRGFLVYVVQGEVAHERAVKLGLHTAEGWVEVRDGLSEGDVIVSRGLEALSEGVRVRVAPAAVPDAGNGANTPPAQAAAEGGTARRAAPGEHPRTEARERAGASSAAEAP